MYQTLYRKYRPRTFSDVCGQSRITSVLRRQVEEGTTTHAYLFCGTRGTGKTTCAKILAKVSNCLNPVDGEPCNECTNCIAADRGELLDVMEVDAASNTGVENIRRLCEELNFLPAQGKKRVYIIDEVHMLSIGAFNALLKTLEEPPAHALFILATTELHKVPATVRSRCQCFTFHRISIDDITKRVLFVSEREGIRLNEEGARLIARLSDGAMRDALSLLELCVGQDDLSEEMLDHLFGLCGSEAIIQLALSALRFDSVRVLQLLDELYASMGDLKEVLSQVLGVFRDLLLYRVGANFETNSNRTTAQQQKLKDFSSSVEREHLLFAVSALEDALVRFDRLSVNKKTICEMALLRICSPHLSDDNEALLARLSAVEEKLAHASLHQAVVPSEPKDQDSPRASKTQDLPPWEEDESAVVPSVMQVEAKKRETPAPAPKKETAAMGGCSYASELIRTLGSNDPLFASFCTNLTMQEEGSVLVIYGESFTITMLTARQQEILELAKKYSPALTGVRFSEGKPKKVPVANADLSDF